MITSVPTIDGEEAVLLIHEHWMRFIPAMLLIFFSWMLYALCGILAAIAAPQSHELSLWIILIGHVFLLLFHHAAFYRYLSVSTRQYLLTNKRIIGSEQRLWVSDDILDIPLYRIRAIEAKEEGILQRLLRFGTLVLNRGELPSLREISHPDAVHDYVTAQLQNLLPATAVVRGEHISVPPTAFAAVL